MSPGACACGCCGDTKPQNRSNLGAVQLGDGSGRDSAPVAALLENHRAFLRYLERRVGDRALAEDILQDAFAKVVARPEQAPADEAIVPWFYRTLRNAAVDQFRRRGAADRAYEAFARELDTRETPSTEMEAEICACVSRLAATLKPEYAEALEAIEVAGTPVKAFAEQKGLSSSNAGGARVPCPRSAEEAGHRVVRHVCGARLCQLHLQTRVIDVPRHPGASFSARSASGQLEWRY